MEIKTFEPADHFVKALVYGASWSWKTTFAWTAKNAIFASAEWWLLAVAEHRPSFVDIKSLKDLQELYDYLKNSKHNFQTVIIDSITEINDIIKNEIEKKTWRAMQLNDWGDLWKKIKWILRDFRNLPIHVLFIAQETFDKDEDKVTKCVPSLNWKAATEIASFMDIVWYIYTDKNGEHKMITSSNEKLLSKDRTKLIWNATEINFNTWIEKVKWIAVGKQEVIAKHELPDEEEVTPPAPKTNEVSEKLRGEFFVNWKNLWDLYMMKYPLEKDENWKLKYTPDTEESSRKLIIKKSYSKDSITELTEKQIKDFIQKIKWWIANLELVDTPFTVPGEIEEARKNEKENK